MLFEKIKVYAFVGPSGTGKSYRAQMVASEKGIHFIIDDGLLIMDNEIVAGLSAKKAPTKIETVKHALFYENEERKPIEKALKKYKPDKILILGTSDGMVQKIAANLGLPEISETTYINEVATEAYDEAIDTNKIDVVSRPTVDIVQMEKGKDLIFTAVFQTKPEAELGKYKGIEIEKIEYNVKDEDIEKELKSMQEQNARLISVEDRAAENGDTATIDFDGYVNGEQFDGGKAKNYDLVLGSH